MKRTKEWWAGLEKWERQWLVSAEYSEKRGGGYGAGGYLPDDCSECSICGEPGACSHCLEEMERIISKADEKVQADREIKDLVIAIFRADKTPGYGYGNKGKRDRNRYGNLPNGVGKRWATPMELAQGYARRHRFERELFEGNPDA